MPSQPAFQAHPASTQSNFPINASTTVVFGTERFDQNSDFTSNTFTAPVTGKYQFNAFLYMMNLDTATTYYEALLVTSNKTYYSIVSSNVFSSDPSYYALNFEVLADMDAGDVAYVVVVIPDSGSAQMDLSAASNFSGFLAC